MTELATKLTDSIQPIADQFQSLHIPEPITHWGHPFFMGIVIVAMGSFVAILGWRSRTTTDTEIANKNKADHRKVAPLMTVFLATGYTGGLLSLVMQGKPLLESPISLQAQRRREAWLLKHNCYTTLDRLVFAITKHT